MNDKPPVKVYWIQDEKIFDPTVVAKFIQENETVSLKETTVDLLAELEFDVQRRSVWIVEVGKADSFKPLMAFVQKNSGHFKNRIFSLIVVTSVEVESISRWLLENGCFQVIPLPMSPKALSLTLDRGYKRCLLSASGERATEEGELILNRVGKMKSDETRTAWLSPLNPQEDCWLTEPEDIKFFRGFWIVRMMGPGPTTGQWTPDGDGWKFNFHEKKHPLARGLQWRFVGKKPDFRDGKWLFISPKPFLGTGRDQKGIRRFYIDPTTGVFSIGKNSTEVEKNKELIISSGEGDLVRRMNQQKDSKTSDVPMLRKQVTAWENFWHDATSLFRPIEKEEVRTAILTWLETVPTQGTWWLPGKSRMGKFQMKANVASLSLLECQFKDGSSDREIFLKSEDSDRLLFQLEGPIGKIFFDPKQIEVLKEGSRFHLEYDHHCFWVQRRRHFRVPKSEALKISFTLNGLPLNFWDIGLSGTRLLDQNGALSDAVVGIIYPSARIHIGKKEFDITIQTRWKNGKEVGVAFVNLPPDIKAVLEAELAVEAKRLLGRLVEVATTRR